MRSVIKPEQIIKFGFVRFIFRWLWRLRALLAGAIVIRVGIAVGQAMVSSNPDTAASTSGIVLALPYMILIAISPVTSVIAWVLSQPFLEGMVNIPMGEGIPDLSLSRLCAGFLIVWILGQAAIRKREMVRIDVIVITSLLFLAGLGLSVFDAVEPIPAVQFILDVYGIPLIAYFVLSNTIKDTHQLHRVMTGLVILGMFVGAYAIYEQITGHILFVSKGTETDFTQYSTNLRILRGLLGDPGTFGLVLTQLVPIGFVLLLKNKNIYIRFFYTLAVIMIILGIFVTFRRTAWIALLTSLFVLQLFYPQFRRLFIVLFFVIAVAMAANWQRINQSEVVQERVNHKLDSANGRDEMWATAQRMWEAKPIFGWGFSQFQNHSGRFRHDGSHENWSDAQSQYWLILVSGGVVAFTPYVVMLLAMLFTSIPLFFKPNEASIVPREFVAVFWSVTVAYLLNQYSAHMAHPLGHLLFFVITGTLIGAPHLMSKINYQASPTNNVPSLKSKVIATKPITLDT